MSEQNASSLDDARRRYNSHKKSSFREASIISRPKETSLMGMASDESALPLVESQVIETKKLVVFA